MSKSPGWRQGDAARRAQREHNRSIQGVESTPKEEGTTMADNGTRKYYLPESEMPNVYYNIMADLPEPPPPVLHPATGQPVGPDDLAPLLPMVLIMQEVSTERALEDPEPAREAHRRYRPSPATRARRLEPAVAPPAKPR